LAEAEPKTPRPAVSVFLSYSRRDYYCAESLHAELVKEGDLKPWMDVRNLGLASDWSTEIDSGLSTADVMVLIASRDAFSSKQVESEWRHAIKRGIPVLLVFARRCDIPEELSHCPSYDVRSDFDSEVGRLRRNLTVRGSIPAASARRCPRFYWPPQAVAVLLAILAFEVALGAWALAFWIYVASSDLNLTKHVDKSPLGPMTFVYAEGSAWIPGALTGAAMVGVLIIPFRIFSSRLNLGNLTDQAVLAVMVALTGIALSGLSRRAEMSVISPPYIFAIVDKRAPLILAMALLAVAAVVELSSRALYRRTELGSGNPVLRSTISGVSISDEVDASFDPTSFEKRIDNLVHEVA
jgi:hypothetical protein